MKRKHLFGVPFVDMHEKTEDDRIDDIVKMAEAKRGCAIGVITDSDPGKADRYIAKLKARCPGIIIEHRGPGPVAKSVLIRVVAPSAS